MDAFDFLHLPLVVKKGSTGELKLIADWKALGSKPVQINIDGIVVLLGPKQDFKLDLEAERKLAFAAKLATLATHQEASLDLSEERSSLVDTVLDNIQISLNNVHVRYEDTQFDGTPCVVGVGFDSMNWFTTNSQGQNPPGFFTEGQLEIYRQVQLEGVQVYLNSQDIVFDRVRTIVELNAELKEQDKRCEHVLKPTSLSLFLINRKEGMSPKFRLKADISRAHFSVNENQWAAILFLVSSFISAIEKMNDSIDTMATRLASRQPTQHETRRYRELYMHTLNCPWVDALSSEQTQELTLLEEQLHLEDLLHLRSYVHLELLYRTETSPDPIQKIQKRATSLFFWKAEAPPVLTDEQKLRLNATLETERRSRKKRSIGEGVGKSASALPAHFVELEVGLGLQELVLTLDEPMSAPSLGITKAERNLMTMCIRGCDLAMIFRPRSSLYRLSVQDMTMTEAIDKASLFPHIVTILSSEDSPTSPQPNPGNKPSSPPAEVKQFSVQTGSENAKQTETNQPEKAESLEQLKQKDILIPPTPIVSNEAGSEKVRKNEQAYTRDSDIKPFLFFEFELHPLDGLSDSRVVLEASTLQLVLNFKVTHISSSARVDGCMHA